MMWNVSHPEVARLPPGRPQATTRDAICRVAFDLFAARGFEAVTVEDIALAAGIGRRTFFRYFPSKNDVVWGAWDAALADLDARLAAAPASAPLAEVLREAVVAYNRVPAAAVAEHRQRMDLILHVPALQAHSALRYAQWRQVVARHVAHRRGELPGALAPQVIAAAILGAATSAYEQWLRRPDAGPRALALLIDRAIRELTAWS